MSLRQKLPFLSKESTVDKLGLEIYFHYSRGDWPYIFLIVIYTACKSLAKWWRLFLGTSHFDLEGLQKYPPAACYGGGVYPAEITNIFSKSHLFEELKSRTPMWSK